jgi:hypothetical protein
MKQCPPGQCFPGPVKNGYVYCIKCGKAMG